ncbi:MAG TPA: ABC transporter ATP-binding protein [Methylomirabilota bacterium]|nr:ABC transporter ATP-binding protein [Methylomirabilota bacterium]
MSAASPRPRRDTPKLAVEGLTKAFGGLRAVSDCSFGVAPATIVGLIGPNGSGKTTVVNLITSLLRPDAGAVFFEGARIDGLPTWEIARRGIGRTFQAVKIFRDLTVWDNLSIAAMGRGLSGWEARARDWLHRLQLAHLVDDAGDSLSVGQQRLLELVMNLVVEPPFLLLDEPLAGVHPLIRQRIAETIRTLRMQGRTFLIIEHDMPFVMELCDKIVVMDHGEKIAEGPPDAIRGDARVIDVLLGQRRAAAGP